jgi:hypothetical protein
MTFKCLVEPVHYGMPIKQKEFSSQLFQTGKRGDSDAPAPPGLRFECPTRQLFVLVNQRL